MRYDQKEWITKNPEKKIFFVLESENEWETNLTFSSIIINIIILRKSDL